jgi:formate hydrogenlyase subunit 6/NADH:ubiquinone oxidoreductase subunit I
MRQQKGYWGNIVQSTRSIWSGLKITFAHIIQARKSQKHLAIQDNAYFNNREGIATVQYPHEFLPVPDTGRYKLHNEIDDCIVCDKCAKVCPVDCITIEPIKATEEFGKTSDGTPKRIYAAKFDIDMGKCCFCGLCTTVCPTECLTMTKTFDFSVYDIHEHVYAFADMTPDQIKEKKQLLEELQKAKAAASQNDTPTPTSSNSETKPARPVFKPKIKPPGA